MGPSQKTDKIISVPPHRRARRRRKHVCSTLGAFWVSGNVDQGRFMAVSKAYSASLPWCRIGAAPCERGNRSLLRKTPLKQMSRTVYSLSAARRERTPPASALPTKTSGIPDPWSIDILPKFGRWSRCQSTRSVVGEVFFDRHYSLLTYAETVNCKPVILHPSS